MRSVSEIWDDVEAEIRADMVAGKWEPRSKNNPLWRETCKALGVRPQLYGAKTAVVLNAYINKRLKMAGVQA